MPIMNQFLIVAVYLCAAILVAFLGRRRKWGFWGYLWSSILFTPFFGLLFILAADPPQKPGRQEQPQ
jgi:hypothetical protein